MSVCSQSLCLPHLQATSNPLSMSLVCLFCTFRLIEVTQHLIFRTRLLLLGLLLVLCYPALIPWCIHEATCSTLEDVAQFFYSAYEASMTCQALSLALGMHIGD